MLLFALAAGAVAFDRWATRRRLQIIGAAFAVLLVLLLPVELPVLGLHAAIHHGIVKTRSDFQDELGWPTLARQVGTLERISDVVLASNYGEAGALELFGHELPPIASGDVSFRYWRPAVDGRAALLVGFTEQQARFCHGYQIVGRIAMPPANAERGQPIARCRLDATFKTIWPQIVRLSG